MQFSGQEDKGALARKSFEQAPDKTGPICTFSAVEPCKTMTVKPNRSSPKLEVTSRTTKCRHYYFYYNDEEFGWMFLKIRTWFPYNIRIYLNGRECLSRLLRFAKERQDIQKAYPDFLRGLFKGAEYVELAYMTGILPIKKYGERPAINIFKEFSMLNPGPFAEYFGFTEEEVKGLCERYGVDYGKTMEWYDGYQLGNLHVYNPQAVTELMDSGVFRSYWTGTETYEALKAYIDLNFDGLKETVIEMLGNARCSIDPSTCQNDMTTFKSKDDVLTLLLHLGYLSFDEEKSEVFIPNQEIAREFMRSVKAGGWDGLIQALERSEGLLQSTWELDGTAVAAGVAAIHNETASVLRYNNENALTCTVLMAYYSAKAYYMNPILELPSGKGFAEVVYLPKRDMDRPALVIELKWN